MIDEFLEFICTPAIPLILQVLLICLNKTTMKEGDKLALFKSMLWIIITLGTFPALLSTVLQVTSSWTFALVSLGLLFVQILMNVEILIIEYEGRNPQGRKYR